MAGLTIKRSIVPCPCYDVKTGTDCKKRHIGRHADCKEWSDYQQKREAEISRIKAEIHAQKDANAYEYAKARRLRRMNRERNKE